MLSIGDLSRRTRVKIPTIRYYEQMGLITAPERSSGNQRRYSNTELQRLAFIKHARDLGISIGDIRELIELGSHPDTPCANVDRIAKQHLETVRDKISQLKRLEKELKRMATGCENGNIKECYVIQSLSNHDLCSEEH